MFNADNPPVVCTRRAFREIRGPSIQWILLLDYLKWRNGMPLAYFTTPVCSERELIQQCESVVAMLQYSRSVF